MGGSDPPSEGRELMEPVTAGQLPSEVVSPTKCWRRPQTIWGGTPKKDGDTGLNAT